MPSFTLRQLTRVCNIQYRRAQEYGLWRLSTGIDMHQGPSDLLLVTLHVEPTISPLLLKLSWVSHSSKSFMSCKVRRDDVHLQSRVWQGGRVGICVPKADDRRPTSPAFWCSKSQPGTRWPALVTYSKSTVLRICMHVNWKTPWQPCVQQVVFTCLAEKECLKTCR
jgi:hypothetical protein